MHRDDQATARELQPARLTNSDPVVVWLVGLCTDVSGRSPSTTMIGATSVERIFVVPSEDEVHRLRGFVPSRAMVPDCDLILRECFAVDQRALRPRLAVFE